MLPGRGTSCQLPSARAFFHDHEGFSVWANAKPFVIMVEGALQRDADGVGAGRRGWRGRKTASVAGLGLTGTTRPPNARRGGPASHRPSLCCMTMHWSAYDFTASEYLPPCRLAGGPRGQYSCTRADRGGSVTGWP